jgi:hypothetical protein
MCRMFWNLFRLALWSLVPLPVNPVVSRPDKAKNLWTFSCDSFTTPFEIVYVKVKNSCLRDAKDK